MHTLLTITHHAQLGINFHMNTVPYATCFPDCLFCTSVMRVFQGTIIQSLGMFSWFNKITVYVWVTTVHGMDGDAAH